MFLPLSLLSYASIIGILSMVMMVAVIFIDGLGKFESPGSIWSPAETTVGVPTLNGLGVSFGLFMAGVRSSIRFATVKLTQTHTYIIVLWTRCHAVSGERYG